MKMKLPIEMIDATNPPRFRWHKTVQSMSGESVIPHTGVLPSQVVEAVLKMIKLCEDQMEEIIKLRKQCEGHAARIVAQSEVIARQAEKQAPVMLTPAPAPVTHPPTQQAPKRGKQ